MFRKQVKGGSICVKSTLDDRFLLYKNENSVYKTCSKENQKERRFLKKKI